MTLSYKIATFTKQLNKCTNVGSVDICYNKAVNIGIPQKIAFSLRYVRVLELRDKYIESVKK